MNPAQAPNRMFNKCPWCHTIATIQLLRYHCCDTRARIPLLQYPCYDTLATMPSTANQIEKVLEKCSHLPDKRNARGLHYDTYEAFEKAYHGERTKALRESAMCGSFLQGFKNNCPAYKDTPCSFLLAAYYLAYVCMPIVRLAARPVF